MQYWTQSSSYSPAMFCFAANSCSSPYSLRLKFFLFTLPARCLSQFLASRSGKCCCCCRPSPNSICPQRPDRLSTLCFVASFFRLNPWAWNFDLRNTNSLSSVIRTPGWVFTFHDIFSSLWTCGNNTKYHTFNCFVRGKFMFYHTRRQSKTAGK